MIAIKGMVREYEVESFVIDEDGEPIGEPFKSKVLRVEGMETCHELIQTKPFVKDEEQVVFVPDDMVKEDDPRRCKPSDFPKREGVPTVGFPPVCPAGLPPSKIDSSGRLVPVDLKTGKIIKSIETNSL